MAVTSKGKKVIVLTIAFNVVRFMRILYML